MRSDGVEDLFDASFYLELLRGVGIANLRVRDLPPGPRLMKRIENHLGRRFDHYQPAAYFQREQSRLLDKVSDNTLNRFEQLFEQINSVL